MKTATALIAILGLALTSAVASAGDSRRASRGAVNNDTLSRRAPEVRGFLFRPGGHRYDFEYEPYLRRSGPYGNYPNFDQRNFRERVFSDPRQDATSPSAF